MYKFYRTVIKINAPEVLHDGRLCTCSIYAVGKDYSRLSLILDKFKDNVKILFYMGEQVDVHSFDGTGTFVSMGAIDPRTLQCDLTKELRFNREYKARYAYSSFDVK